MATVRSRLATFLHFFFLRTETCASAAVPTRGSEKAYARPWLESLGGIKLHGGQMAVPSRFFFFVFVWFSVRFHCLLAFSSSSAAADEASLGFVVTVYPTFLDSGRENGEGRNER
ncbi:pr108 [rat cytomegalovirus strain Maastricht]|uniref:Pr108 n=1 Tax=Rat cytomegalovirus (strain Maastricht) TaxID=79700 RepID=Q9DW93_RCMVM|nr:pr108 [rat cytomegalovirus strain Maastricht]AAF99197.1 pr108 [rat cytomegalovirus strain Maastricht]